MENYSIRVEKERECIARERQEQNVLKKILERKSRIQIAEELNIVPRSVDNYISHLFDKTGCKGIDEIISNFREHRLSSVQDNRLLAS